MGGGGGALHSIMNFMMHICPCGLTHVPQLQKRLHATMQAWQIYCFQLPSLVKLHQRITCGVHAACRPQKSGRSLSAETTHFLQNYGASSAARGLVRREGGGRHTEAAPAKLGLGITSHWWPHGIAQLHLAAVDMPACACGARPRPAVPQEQAHAGARPSAPVLRALNNARASGVCACGMHVVPADACHGARDAVRGRLPGPLPNHQKVAGRVAQGGWCVWCVCVVGVGGT